MATLFTQPTTHPCEANVARSHRTATVHYRTHIQNTTWHNIMYIYILPRYALFAWVLQSGTNRNASCSTVIKTGVLLVVGPRLDSSSFPNIILLLLLCVCLGFSNSFVLVVVQFFYNYFYIRETAAAATVAVPPRVPGSFDRGTLKWCAIPHRSSLLLLLLRRRLFERLWAT